MAAAEAQRGAPAGPLRARLIWWADGIAIWLAASLPWSTTATLALAILWLIVALPIIEPSALRRVLTTPAGGLPVLLFVLATVGMLWAFGLPMKERFDGLSGYYEL